MRPPSLPLPPARACCSVHFAAVNLSQNLLQPKTRSGSRVHCCCCCGDSGARDLSVHGRIRSPSSLASLPPGRLPDKQALVHHSSPSPFLPCHIALVATCLRGISPDGTSDRRQPNRMLTYDRAHYFLKEEGSLRKWLLFPNQPTTLHRIFRVRYTKYERIH